MVCKLSFLNANCCYLHLTLYLKHNVTKNCVNSIALMSYMMYWYMICWHGNLIFILCFPGIQEKLGIMNNGAVYAVFDFTRENSDELDLSMGDKFTVLKKGDEHEKEWWWARKNTDESYGYIPRNLLGVSLKGFSLFLFHWTQTLQIPIVRVDYQMYRHFCLM